MGRRLLLAAVGLYLFAATAWVVAAGFVRDTGRVELLNVACDPTRELWHDLNARFVARYARETGQEIAVRQSHGGSASQARAVIDGLDADVVTLGLWADTDAVRKAGRIDPGWENRLPNRSLPYVSTIVFVVRAGNPKGVKDWPDLARPDVGVVTPDPKTSGNGKWSFLALWGSVTQRGGSDDDARKYVTGVFRNVKALDTSARAATASFAQRGQGDVHLTWENEARLEVQEAKGKLEIVYPSRSVLAEPHVAIVDAVVRKKGTRAAAEAYMKFLYTEEAQEAIARNHHRPTQEPVKSRTRDQFHELTMFPPVPALAPGWDAIQAKFFAEGAEFDRIQASIHGGRS
jgi:sulfate transport system substrate-binding protein